MHIHPATPADAPTIVVMVGELLQEIMQAIGEQAFNFDRQATTERLQTFICDGHYHVFVATDASGTAAGFLTLYQSYALYAEGSFGTIPELYVRPAYRLHGTGKQLLAAARAFGASKGWTRLEVTTPPLPAFERTLVFYEREGFAITGGRKLKTLL
ncbi:GNAT family N-acetyltransferase [Thiothrix lacustris]|uniref:GNAT family N-acetyltransferase n=1 Tax=Thiothrix lacustris TaxID=525917 RepID=UPI0027E5BAE0|nr:GNAT family N-acetyltransferase [Thiothrix lacustris]WMP19036.1 GNAT family N-acetyltransferase [Thiothrix lacustris]